MTFYSGDRVTLEDTTHHHYDRMKGQVLTVQYSDGGGYYWLKADGDKGSFMVFRTQIANAKGAE